MKLLKTHSLLSIVNSYVIDSPQPTNISYLWNFGSLLASCLIIQIITGIFLAMHVRLLICIEPAEDTALTELMLSKTIALAVFEKNKRVEHGRKVLKISSYNYSPFLGGGNYPWAPPRGLSKGELISIHESLIHLSQDARLDSKITVTSLLGKNVESAYTSLNSPNMILKTFLKMESKDRIEDSIHRTRDHLRKVISILGLETKTLKCIFEEPFHINKKMVGEIEDSHSMGDGEIVVPVYNKEGFQDSIVNKNRTRGLLHSTPLLKANAKGYYLKPYNLRYISSESLKDIEVYKKAYNKIKSNSGYMTSGTDNETLDGMSMMRLNKLRISILN